MRRFRLSPLTGFLAREKSRAFALGKIIKHVRSGFSFVPSTKRCRLLTLLGYKLASIVASVADPRSNACQPIKLYLHSLRSIHRETPVHRR